MKRLYLVSLLGFTLALAAQEKLGITNSNYSPTNSIYLNPSSSVDSKTYMQLNLAGVNAFFFNNMAYLPWFSVWRMQRHGGEIQFPKLNTSRLDKYVYANGGIDGPAFVISKRNYGAGVFMRLRSVLDIRGLPYELGTIFIKQTPYKDVAKEGDISIRNMKFSNLSWLEVGANFGMMYKRDKKDLVTMGGNLKYLSGINIFYANVARIKGSYKDSILTLDQMSGKMRYNNPAPFSGKGAGIDFGVTYKKMLKTVDNYLAHSKQGNCTTLDYKFRAAVSLRDLGVIMFTNGGTKTDLSASGQINASSDTTQSKVESSLNLVIKQGNIFASLPTNLSAQFDWNFENHLFLNGTIVANILPHRLTGAQGPNLISISPRLEFKHFELAMPLTFQKFYHPQLGFAFRVRSFVLGFDNVFPLLFMKPKTYGAGVYFNLGVSLFKNPACRKSQRAVDCPPNSITRAGKKTAWWKFWKRKRK